MAWHYSTAYVTWSIHCVLENNCELAKTQKKKPTSIYIAIYTTDCETATTKIYVQNFQ